MTATAVIALFVFVICIAAASRPVGRWHCRRTAEPSGRLWPGDVVEDDGSYDD
jgi:hypothetical protein